MPGFWKLPFSKVGACISWRLGSLDATSFVICEVAILSFFFVLALSMKACLRIVIPKEVCIRCPGAQRRSRRPLPTAPSLRFFVFRALWFQAGHFI